MEWVKTREDAPAGLFRAEAAGLEWLRVPGGVPVVKVLAVSETSITVERVRRITPTPEAAQDFGRALVRTHDAGADGFGAAPEGYTGPCFIADLPMSTDPMPTWGEFYARQRVMPYVTLARGVGTDEMRTFSRLADRLIEGVFDDDSPPARLHGDLWSGNVIFAPNGATVIDPSAHGGHRLSDLAMLSLFGTPHLDQILQGYESASTMLPGGWRRLISLHQVYPLLVHAVLFGGGYWGAAIQAARAYL